MDDKLSDDVFKELWKIVYGDDIEPGDLAGAEEARRRRVRMREAWHKPRPGGQPNG
jgi:hypothetical protein